MPAHAPAMLVGTAGMLAIVGCAPPDFDSPTAPATQKYDFEQMAWYAALAFDITELNKDPNLEPELRRHYQGQQTEISFRALDDVAFTYLFMTEDDARRHLIVLPGTTNLTNIEIDLMGQWVADDQLGISLHTGFRTAARSVRSDVAPLLKKNYRVTIVGFSLGGATAAILAPYLLSDGFKVNRVLTFGQPKVTDAIGAAQLAHVPILRVIAGTDPIPSRPLGAYAHFGDALIVLDGPYIVDLPFGGPEIEPPPNDSFSLDDIWILEHVTYPARIAAKIGVEVIEVEFAERTAYLGTVDD